MNHATYYQNEASFYEINMDFNMGVFLCEMQWCDKSVCGTEYVARAMHLALLFVAWYTSILPISSILASAANLNRTVQLWSKYVMQLFKINYKLNHG